MCKNETFSAVLLLVLSSVAFAQTPLLYPVYTTSGSVFVASVAPQAGYTGTLTLTDCSIAGVPIPHSAVSPAMPIASGAKPVVTFTLTNKLAKGTQVCVIESYSGAAPLAPVNSTPVTVADRPLITIAKILSGDKSIVVTPIPPDPYTATVDIYAECPPLTGAGANSLVDAKSSKTVDTKGGAITLGLQNPLGKAGGKVCAVETYVGATGIPALPQDVSDASIIAAAAATSNDAPHFSENFLGLLGVSYAGASSTDPQTKLLANVSADIPVAKWTVTPFKELNAWGYGRIGSISQNIGQTPGTVVQPAQVVSAYSSLSSATPSQIVQSFEMKAGLSLETGRIADRVPGYKLAFAMTASVGALTPTSPNQTQITSQTYQFTTDVQHYFTQQNISVASSGCTNLTANSSSLSCLITLYPQNRGRFFRSYDAGFRLKLYPNGDGTTAPLFPGTFDLTVGQNEYVTGGNFTGPVVHVAVNFPIISGSYVFAGMDVATNGRGDSGPIFLSPTSAQLAASVASPPTNTTLVAQVPQPNRDRYMIGFGVDVIYLIRNHLFQDNK